MDNQNTAAQQGQKNGHINANATRLGAQPAAPAQPEREAVRQRLSFSLHELTTLTIRLAHVLAEEVDCLEEMRVRDIEKLQAEKTRLTRVITAMKQEIERVHGYEDYFRPEEKEEFRRVAAVFEEVLEENRQRLLVAKSLNEQMVQAIADVVCEEAARAGYNQKGKNGMDRSMTPSVTLNKTI